MREFRLVFDSLDTASEFQNKYARTYYNGKPTKRFQKWLAQTGRREATVMNKGLIDKILIL